MQKSSNAADYRGLLLSIFVLGLITTLFVVPNLNRSKAVSSGNQKNEGQTPVLENYDIREDKNAYETLTKFRQDIGTNAIAIADMRDNFVRGENELRSRVPTLKVEYSTNLQTPALISPDVNQAKIERLTAPSTVKRSEILRNFIKENNNLIGISDAQADSLVVKADYMNPSGYLAFARLEQEINSIPVYQSEIRAGFTKSGQMMRVLNDLAPGIDYNTVSRDFGDPLDAVVKAFDYINSKPTRFDTKRNDAASTDLKTIFGNGDWATTAEKMYFPTEIGVARASWRVLIWQPVDAFYVIVDAETGMLLSRENITVHQTQPATYQVYANPNAYVNLAESPAPLTPGPNSPNGMQGAVILSRTSITSIGNEAPNPGQNNLGWITDGNNFTDGNNVEAGVDRDTTNGVDATQPGDGACPGAGCRMFTSTWNPPPGNPPPGDDPLTPQAQRGAVIQMFYAMNLYHDALYELGFTEQARNYQHDNFGRGGVGGDRISAEGQDNTAGTSACPTAPCFNNANFSPGSDGTRGRMQMYLWNGPTPDYDGTADADIIFHEVTHGTSTRLHNGLGNQGGMMGEGWSDWYAHTMLAEPLDPINGIYTTGGYATYLGSPTYTSNYYYGIRRFPKAVIAFTGGPNNRPHNPLTFKHINSDCDTTIGTSSNAIISAYPRNPVFGSGCSGVHAAGEIWSSALWEVRALMVTRLGFSAGTKRVLQVVTDGMKLSPANPMMLQERDAIIMAASALPLAPEAAADVTDVREGFRRRGMGFSAQTISSTSVVEAFDGWSLAASGTSSVTSGNGLLEPNECNTLNVPITNNGGATATNITGVLSSNTPGITVTQPNAAYPDIPAGGGPVNNTTPYEISVDNTVACYTSANFTLTVTFSGSGGGSPIIYNFSLPVGIPGQNYMFATGTGTIPAGGTLVAGSQADDAAVPIPLPSGWTSSIYDQPVTSLSASTNGMLTANGTASTTVTNAALPANVGGGNPTLLPYWDDLIMTTARSANAGIFVNTVGTAPNRQFVVEWRAQHFNGNVPETGITFNIAVVLNEGSSQIDYIYATTGASVNTNGSSATIGVQRTTTGTRFTQFSFNQSSVMPGMKLTGTLPPGQCTPGPGGCNVIPVKSRADFDGDGKTDLSVFRPGEGNWYLQRSTAGFAGLNWGLSSDVLVPGDYDGDGKTDTAIFRATDAAGVADFYILNSNNFTFTGYEWGSTGDVPVVGDYDGDEKTDVGIWRPSTGEWYIINTSGSPANTITVFGQSGDTPLAADWDGDGKADLSFRRGSTWMANLSGGGTVNVDFGMATDMPVQADYDGDNKDDIAVWRPSTGNWMYIPSSGGANVTFNFGLNGDVPVPGDYDGDGRDDYAVYRNGTWYVQRSTSGFFAAPFGLGTDKPVPRAYIP